MNKERILYTRDRLVHSITATTIGTKIAMVATTLMIVWSTAAYIRNVDNLNTSYGEIQATFEDIKSSKSPFEASMSSPLNESESFDNFTEPFLLPLPTEPIIGQKVAAIVEDRPLNNLVPLVLHFASVLGPSWPIYIYTSEATASNLSTYTSLKRWSHQIGIRTLPANTTFEGHDAVSEFLTNPWLWESLAPAEHVLLFQADSIICANAQQSIEDFLGYDFIGAPVRHEFGSGYNGGLSLRNRPKILDLVTQYDWVSEKGNPGSKWEDQWFYTKMKERPEMRLPTYEVASQFAVETIYYDRPLGYHQIKRWQADNMEEIELWCPEIKMASGSTFFP